jgi:transcriptional regulator with XRE-family HTH domain
MYKKLKIKKDVEFSKISGVSPTTISSWRKNQNIPFQVICEVAEKENISIDYLLFGTTATNTISRTNKEENIVNDFILLLGSEELAKEYLVEKMLELIIERFQKENLGSIYNTLIKICRILFLDEKGLEARPILFLYYILNYAILHPRENPKDTLMEAIQNTEFSRLVFGVEFSRKKVDEFSDYLLHAMSDEELDILMSNIPKTIEVLEKKMPSLMIVAHKKHIKNIQLK